MTGFTPFWAPLEFAVAMFAHWIGPRLGDTTVLGVFANEPHSTWWGFLRRSGESSMASLLRTQEVSDGADPWSL